MKRSEIPHIRLHNQRLLGEPFERPEDAVAWLGAVQSQDYAAAKWGLGLRLNGTDDAALDEAFNRGAILRTHAMRPTWHFLAPADIRWILALTSPRVHALCAYHNRKLELDTALLVRCCDVLVKALRDGRQRTRDELREDIQRARIPADGLRMAHIVMYAELEGIVCSGPRRGKQFTYMLLDERVPPAPTLDRDAALAELVRRYFTSHGPATPHDFAWWSGLSVTETRRGLAMLGKELASEPVDEQTYWFAPNVPRGRGGVRAHLLPNYDEYGSYREYSLIFESTDAKSMVFTHNVAINGRIAGTWTRTLRKSRAVIEMKMFESPSSSACAAVDAAIRRYGRFLNLPIEYTE